LQNCKKKKTELNLWQNLRNRTNISLKNRFFFTIIFTIILYNSIYSNEMKITGKIIQSGLIRLEIPKNVTKVLLNNEELDFFEGRAYVGFSRKDTLIHNLKYIFEDGIIKNEILKLEERSYNIQRIDNIPKKYVEKPKSEELIKRINLEYQIITDVRKNIIYHNKNLYFTDIIQPLRNKISSIFGSQRIINNIPKRPHFGIDYAAKTGTPIQCCADGVVILTGHYFYNGKFILVDHGLGLSSIYLHLDEIRVHQGQKVAMGDIIAKVGSTGKSTGAHLHWGFYWYDKPIDPLLVWESFRKDN